MIRTNYGETHMDGSLEELVADYLLISAAFKEKLLAGMFTHMEDVEEMMVEVQEAADVPCGIISACGLDADAVDAARHIIKKTCESFRACYEADQLTAQALLYEEDNE